MRLLSYNIRYGGSGREKQIASVINACEPDTVILQEATSSDVVRKLSEACRMKVWGARPGESLAFLSRLEVGHYNWHDVFFGRRRYLQIVLAKSQLRIFGVHLSAIHSNLTELRRKYELQSLLSQIAEYGPAFHVITGDFNTLAQGEELDVRRLPLRLRALLWLGGGPIQWRTLALMTEAGYTDGYRQLHPQTAGPTFPSWDPHIRLDYIFTPKPFAGRLRQCEVVRTGAARDASDHLPLLSVIDD